MRSVKDLKASVRNSLYNHAVLDLTEITEDTEGGSDKALKNLCVLSASVCNSASHGVPKGHEEESRQSFKTSVSPRLRAKLFV